MPSDCRKAVIKFLFLVASWKYKAPSLLENHHTVPDTCWTLAWILRHVGAVLEISSSRSSFTFQTLFKHRPGHIFWTRCCHVSGHNWALISLVFNIKLFSSVFLSVKVIVQLMLMISIIQITMCDWFLIMIISSFIYF